MATRLFKRENGQSVEDVLGVYAGEQSTYPHRTNQLAAIRFYIQAIIHECEAEWYAGRQLPTNLMALIDEFERHRGDRERPLFVTFNYDRLIENALSNRRQVYRNLGDYINPTGYQLVKLHGSVNWARRIAKLDSHEFSSGGWTVARQIVERIRDLPKPGEIVMADSPIPSTVDNHIALPAIAIPVKDKNSFECPPKHTDVLKATLPRVTTLLTIGWRGAEAQFLSLLKENLKSKLDGICVCGDSGAAAETAANLHRAGIRGNFEPYDAGFTNFIQQRRVQRLLNISW